MSSPLSPPFALALALSLACARIITTALPCEPTHLLRHSFRLQLGLGFQQTPRLRRKFFLVRHLRLDRAVGHRAAVLVRAHMTFDSARHLFKSSASTAAFVSLDS